MRLIATDLDGTLLQADLSISRRAKAAITAATDAGIVVVAATGRGFRGAVAILEQVPEIHTVVGSNGAIVRDIAADETIYARTLDAAGLAEVNGVAARIVPDAGLAWELSHGGFRADGRYLDIRADMAARWPDALTPTPIVGDDVLKVLVRDEGMDESELLATLTPHLPASVEATFSGIETVEITGSGVHKASALAWLCDRWGIDAADVTAVGDNRNDIEMLRWAGHGVAMGTAGPDVVAAADSQTLDHDADGAALVIETVVEAAGDRTR